ncbi:hypothetical protein HHI36_009328 [Cryptolaemus montrouzieri]|uniref:Uncharacterized protein n=1 Tax=Cryptolaemus montrouzieri TaxID=559131 RepID=A0ABD2MV23_9CUCU
MDNERESSVRNLFQGSRKKPGQSTAKMGNTQVDRYNASIILFYFLGIMTQVTNNFIINPQLYWRYKFRTIGEPWDPASNTTNEMQNDFTAEFSVVANTAAVIGLGIAIVVGRLFGSITRIFGGLCGFIVGFVVLSISAMINTDTWQKEYLCSVLVLFFVLTCFGSVFLVALFEMAAKFTPNYYAATISGQAVCGIFSSAIQILTLMQNVPASTSGLLYFSVAIVCIVLTTLAFYLTMRNSSFFRYHLEQVKIQEDQKEEITKDIIFMVLRKQLLYSLVMVLVFGATAMVHPSITSTVREIETLKLKEKIAVLEKENSDLVNKIETMRQEHRNTELELEKKLKRIMQPEKKWCRWTPEDIASAISLRSVTA